MLILKSVVSTKIQGIAIAGNIAVLLAISSAAFADQCAYVSQEVAQRAVEVLSVKKKVADFCEPCGNTVPNRVYKIKEVVAAPADYEDYWKVLINGEEVDLAYLYVKTGLVTFKNAGMLAGCTGNNGTGIEGVSASIIPALMKDSSKNYAD
jgi:hypothetical protein